MSREENDAKAEQIIANHGTTSATADDPELERLAQAKLAGLEEQQQLLIDEYDRIQQRKATYTELYKDAFFEQSINEAETAIAIRLAQVKEALAPLEASAKPATGRSSKPSK
jgi:hypothetical protein